MRTDSRELTEWMAYESLEPFGPHAVNLNAGLIASMIANVNLKKGAEPYYPSDFSLGDIGKKEKKEQTVEDMKSLFVQIADKTATKPKEN